MTEIVKAAGRTLAEFQPLKPAEQKLLAACRQGEFANVSDKRPEAANDNNTVRAAFLRFLALGGDEQAPVHEHGVQLKGAWVEGVLDLDGARILRRLGLQDCHFSDVPLLRDSRIYGTLNLTGSHVNGLDADRMVCDGSVFLRRGFTAKGKVHLLGAQIGGNLDCSGAKLHDKNGYALWCDNAVVKGSVFLVDFTANGEVRLIGAQIGGALDCEGAKLSGKDDGGDALVLDSVAINSGVFLVNFTARGTVRLLGAQIGGDLACICAKFDSKKGNALSCDGANIAGAFFFREHPDAVDGVNLASMRVGTLVDDKQSWGKRLILDGFVYGELSGDAPTDADTRLAWLNKQLPSHAGPNGDGTKFKPQPWQQLIRVLRHMGHAEDARQVAIAFEHRLRRANLIGQTPKVWSKPRVWLYRNLSRTAHWLFWLLTGYGYRPLRMLGWMFGVWLVCGMFYWYAALDGVFAPSDPLVFQNTDYKICAAQNAVNWYLCEKLPEEYTGFSPLAYSLDVILPLVDLQQETDWAPLIPTPKSVWYQELLAVDLKHVARLVVWFEILFGWVASLLLVAVVSGLTKRREE